MRKAISFLFLIALSSVFAQTKNSLLQISHLTGDFYIYRTFNKYKGNLISANAMYLVTQKGVVLFDSPWDKNQFQPLLDSIKARHGKEVLMYFATHSHDDRAGGFDFYRKKGIKTYSIQQTDEILKTTNKPRAEIVIRNDTVLNIGEHSFRIFYPGKGHAPDNIVVWFDKEKVLYGGCFVKSVLAKDLGYLGDSDVVEWEKSIKNVQTSFSNPLYVIPGHGDWDNVKSLDHTLQLIQEYNKSNRSDQSDKK
ncbi:BlaB/IND/MUS family subclass B1 metallo-beta-lactamase [Flavobacterium adhaerens]|uniref:BlaB/IND/MUS family subclass B1 metallo-beta-lactamase n=1 Tax=Flavobacterium adhaerens TaxID=3149043 RepID=UPI0032B39F0E